MKSRPRACFLLALLGAAPACHLVLGHRGQQAAGDLGPSLEGGRADRTPIRDAPGEQDASELDARGKADSAFKDLPGKEAASKDLPGADEGTPTTCAVNVDAVCTNDWCWQHPLPQGNTLRAITHVGSTQFAVGVRGTILRKQAQGWKRMSSGTTVDLNGVHAAAANKIHAVGAAGTVLVCDGNAWSSFQPAPATNAGLQAVQQVGNELLAAGAGGLTLRFAGGAWDLKLAGTSNLHAVWGDATSTTMLVGGDAGIYRLTAGSWKPEPTMTSIAVRGFGGSAPAIYAVGAQGAVKRWDGSGWKEESSDTPNDLEDVTSSGSATVAVGYGGVVTERSASGTWTASSPPTRPLFGVDLDAAGLTVVGWYGTIARRENGSWTTNSASTQHLRAVWGDGATWFAVGSEGTILRGSAGVWQGQPSGTSQTLRGVWGSSATDVYAVGDTGTILHYDGAGWTPMSSGTNQNLRGIVGSATEVFAVGGGPGGIVLRRVSGGSWNQVHTTPNSLLAVAASAPTNLVAVGTTGLAVRWNGTAWVSLPSAGETLVSVSTRGPNDTWALGTWSGGAAKVHHFQGTAWSPAGLPPANLTVSAILATPKQVLVAGEGGYAASNLGGSWKPIDLGTAHGIAGLWQAGNLITAVGDGGGILQYCGTP